MMGDDMTWIPDGSPNSIGRPSTPEEKKAYSAAEDSEPIHAYFELTYDTHLVMHRTLLQSMPVEWQSKFVKLLEEYDSAFAHVEKSPMIVQAGELVELNEATPEQLKRGGWTGGGEECECTFEKNTETGEWESFDCEPCKKNPGGLFYDMYGDEYPGHESVLIPSLISDPVPHYNRGRTRIEPRLGSAV